jgi:hypothetical protein
MAFAQQLVLTAAARYALSLPQQVIFFAQQSVEAKAFLRPSSAESQADCEGDDTERLSKHGIRDVIQRTVPHRDFIFAPPPLL